MIYVNSHEIFKPQSYNQDILAAIEIKLSSHKSRNSLSGINMSYLKCDLSLRVHAENSELFTNSVNFLNPLVEIILIL